MKLWDETVFGHSSLSTTSGKPGRSKDEKGTSRGRNTQPASVSVRGGSKSSRGGTDTGRKEWSDLRDPITFASEEVCGVQNILCRSQLC